MGIKIILLLFVIFAESRVIMRWRDKAISFGECTVWTTLWSLAVVIIVVPELTSRVANVLGVGRGADLVVYASILLLFYVQFRHQVRLERMERNITELTRAQAIAHSQQNTPLDQKG